MDLIKITLFLAFVALSQCDQKLETELLGDDKDFEVTAELTAKAESPSRRFFFLNKPKQDCICLPPGPAHASKVTDLLHPRPGSKEMRLVVYIFKNSVTGEYKIYVPNAARQRVFPDIAYEVNEVLRPVEHTLIFNKVLFNVHSWVTVKTKSLPTTTTKKPIPVTPEKPIVQGNTIIIDIINQSNKDKMKGLLGYLNRFKETKKILGTLTGITLKDKLLQLKRLHPSVYKKFVTKITKFYPVWLNKGNIIRFKPGQLQRFPYDIKLIPQLNGKRVIINGQLQTHRNVQEIIVYTPKRTIINELYPAIDINTNISFKEWLEIMVKGLQNHLKFASKGIDIVALKSFILNVIQKHELSVTVEDHVVDSYGRRIQLSNIILRPILIGESALINKVINNGLFRIPSGIIFLEALLISASTIKSLGIVPISNIFVGYHEEIISQSTTVQIVESIKTCENDVCKTRKICKNVQGQEEPCKDFSKLRSEQAERSGNHKVCQRSGCKHKKCKHKLCENQVIVKVNPSTTILTEGLEPMDVVEIPVADPSIPEPYIIMDKSGNMISTAVEDEKSGAPEYDTTYTDYLPIDEEPGIRIVGGNAATNSGTPVNVKGRSGYTSL